MSNRKAKKVKPVSKANIVKEEPAAVIRPDAEEPQEVAPPSGGIKLNLGCGQNPLAGAVNVDLYSVEADVKHDLEVTPWPFEDNSVDEIIARHILEHLASDVDTYIRIWKEMYRVLKHGGFITLAVPHHNSDDFHGDPTHVRKYTPMTLALWDKTLNAKWKEMGAANTPMGLYHDVDFRILSVDYVPSPGFQARHQAKEPAAFEQAFQLELPMLNNVCSEVRMIVVARKETPDA